MTEAERQIALMQAERERLDREGLYRIDDDRDSCGVGLVAAIDGKPQRKVVTMAIQALKALWHRGAVDADGKTGDGAGILLDVSQDFFHDVVRRNGHTPSPAPVCVGQVFLPRTDFAGQETARGIVESEILRAGFYIYGWRQVPVNVGLIGAKALATRPEIEQVLFYDPLARDSEALERALFICRRRIENRAIAANLTEFYMCSLSTRTVIYKGMFLAEQVDQFYPDLQDERFISAVAIYHQRY